MGLFGPLDIESPISAEARSFFFFIIFFEPPSLIFSSKMAENPLQSLLVNFGKLANFTQTHISNFVPRSPSTPTSEKPLISLSSSPSEPNPSSESSNLIQTKVFLSKEKSNAPVTKEDLGRSTWMFLHTLAAQYPENPTRQQKKDVKELMSILSRMYPCKECADHFKEILRTNPVQAGSQADFSQWMCYVHNVVNRSLGKLVFPCSRVDARWGKLDCEQRACDLQGATNLGITDTLDFSK